jgi:hypothetical protein
MTTVDGNKDGQLSTEEFTSFLTKLLTGIRTEATSASGLALAHSPYAATAAGAAAGTARFEGFDFARPQDPQKSAKDAFAMLAQQAGTMPQTKAEAEAWFNATIKTQMEGLGHKVNWVKGDKFQFTNWQGTFTVDFVRGADGPNPAFHWGVE